jgi:hypothetical protein
MQFQHSRAGCPHTWQLAGLYRDQYVASNENEQSRAVILSAMEAILTQEKASTTIVSYFLAMSNRLLPGADGSNKFAEQDRAMDDWVSAGKAIYWEIIKSKYLESSCRPLGPGGIVRSERSWIALLFTQPQNSRLA